jgi:hypothetical protein
MTAARPTDRQARARCDLRPELAACFAVGCPAPAAARPVIPQRGVLAELARYGRP